MNVQNIKKAIAIMERAKKHDSLSMVRWQSVEESELKIKEEDLHACGNKACFGGHIAISPEFIADGGYVSSSFLFFGSPFIDAFIDNQKYTLNREEAIAYWLDIPNSVADNLVYGDVDDSGIEDVSFFYDKLWKDVTADDVIEKLNLILNGELYHVDE